MGCSAGMLAISCASWRARRWNYRNLQGTWHLLTTLLINICNGQVPLSPAQAPDRCGWHAGLRWCTF